MFFKHITWLATPVKDRHLLPRFVMMTIEQLNHLIKDFEGTLETRNNQAKALDADLRAFVLTVATFCKKCGLKSHTIGDKRQGITITDDERYTLDGIFTRSILNGYIDAFAEFVKSETAKLTNSIEKLYR